MGYLKSNTTKRIIFTIVLLAYLILALHLEILFIILHAFAIELQCSREVLNLWHISNIIPKSSRIKWLYWYFIILANYFFIGNIVHSFDADSSRSAFAFLFKYYKFTSFAIYILGLIIFLILLRRQNERYHFSTLAFTHLVILFIGVQTYFAITNVLDGLIWLIFPILVIACNDVFAYIFGKFIGKTPLIQLSPKKTYEGFLGAAVSTVTIGIILANFLCQFKHFTTSAWYVHKNYTVGFGNSCNIDNLFHKYNYVVHGHIKFSTYPFVLHSIVFVIFASTIAPIAGFFASGFKRAFNTKDFGDLIPGHGGVLDRFDCQGLMATFVYVYLNSFLKPYSVEDFLRRAQLLEIDDQLKFYDMLQHSLNSRSLP